MIWTQIQILQLGVLHTIIPDTDILNFRSLYIEILKIVHINKLWVFEAIIGEVQEFYFFGVENPPYLSDFVIGDVQVDEICEVLEVYFLFEFVSLDIEAFYWLGEGFEEINVVVGDAEDF